MYRSSLRTYKHFCVNECTNIRSARVQGIKKVKHTEKILHVRCVLDVWSLGDKGTPNSESFLMLRESIIARSKFIKLKTEEKKTHAPCTFRQIQIRFSVHEKIYIVLW